MKRMSVVLALVLALVLSGVATVSAGGAKANKGKVTTSGPILPGGSWQN